MPIYLTVLSAQYRNTALHGFSPLQIPLIFFIIVYFAQDSLLSHLMVIRVKILPSSLDGSE